MSDKSNLDHLRNIIKELTITNAAKQEEAFEFLDALEKEGKDKDEEISDLEKRIKDIEGDDDESGKDIENMEDVGLDVIWWELGNGNLRIQQEMENFMQVLKKKYIGVTA